MSAGPVIAVIPARGGSKGIPRKNLALLGGRPLLVWTVDQALQSTSIDRVIVSTEDDEIAAVALAAGAEVPFRRPAHLAQDITATEPVVEHLLDELAARGEEPGLVMLLQATSPIRLPGTLDRLVAEQAATGADSLVGVVPQAPFLWWRDDPPRADYDVTRRPRRQDLTDRTLRYRETGSAYLTKTDIYRCEHNRLGGRIELFVMAEVEGIDIDTELDFAFAERELARLGMIPEVRR